MTFSSTIKHTSVAGDLKIVNGVWDSADVITGNIDTGMTYIYDINVTEKGGAIAAALSGVRVDETLPGSSGRAVTIHSASDASGTFTAWGKG
jgi:hypothetical protein